jgi:c-di-GMP-binding flagellar brake protein YcgR
MAKRNMNVEERRKYPRIRVRWAVSIQAADGSSQGEIEDISLGGAFIICEKPPRPNDKVLLNYRDHSKQMQVIAQVAWTNHESESSRDKPTGVGVKFLQFLNNQRSTER